ncbi:hypothetical protein KBA73_04790 [Patescibacteria group bacterium]|nr:hypothetical protein [Patescibacteria group bacterium]
MATTTQLAITDGPGKLDLLFALFDHSNVRARHVQFTIRPLAPSGARRILDVMILSIEREDGSGESWNIRARSGSNDYDIHYRTDKRSGHVLDAGPAAVLDAFPRPFKILNGPSKYEFAIGLFEHNGSQARPISLTVETPTGICVPRGCERNPTNDYVVMSVEREDGSGESWNLIVRDQFGEYKMHYNTRRREGHLTTYARVAANPAA